MIKPLRDKAKSKAKDLHERAKTIHARAHERAKDIHVMAQVQAKGLQSRAQELHKRATEYRTRNRTVAAFLFLFLVFFVANHLLHYLDARPNIAIPPVVYTVSEVIMWGIFAFFIVSIILRLTTGRVFEFFEGDVEIEQRIFLTRLYRFALYALAVLFIFYKSGLSFNSIALIAGFIATGLGIALRDFIYSYVMWFVILNKRPFRIGDHIRIGDDAGRIERIGTLYLTLAGEEPGTWIKVPNNTLLQKTAANYGTRGVFDTVRMPLQFVPEDVGERLERLMGELAAISDDGASASFSTESGRPMLVANYYALTGTRTEKRKQALVLMRKAFDGIPNL